MQWIEITATDDSRTIPFTIPDQGSSNACFRNVQGKASNLVLLKGLLALLSSHCCILIPLAYKTQDPGIAKRYESISAGVTPCPALNDVIPRKTACTLGRERTEGPGSIYCLNDNLHMCSSVRRGRLLAGGIHGLF